MIAVPLESEDPLLLPLIALDLENKIAIELNLDADVGTAILGVLREGDENAFAHIFADLEGNSSPFFIGISENAEAIDAERAARALHDVGAAASKTGDRCGELEGLVSTDLRDILAKEEIGDDGAERKGRNGLERDLGIVEGTVKTGDDRNAVGLCRTGEVEERHLMLNSRKGEGSFRELESAG